MADYKKFFNKPTVAAPSREQNFVYDTTSDVSEQTVIDAATSQNPVRQIQARALRAQRTIRRVKQKTELTLAYHRIELAANPIILENVPINVQAAFESLHGKPLESIHYSTPEEIQCEEQIASLDKNKQEFSDALSDSPVDSGNGEAVLELLKRMTKKKFAFGLEFLLRLIRLCLAYAVHMIIGGLCNFFIGKINIPIPFIGSVPLGTMIALSILAPVERTAKAALGFPCRPDAPMPEFCFDFFTKDKEAFNLLPCCIPAGLSGALLKLEELKERSKGSPLSANVDDFLKDFVIKGGFSQGYIQVGKNRENVNLSDGVGKIINAGAKNLKEDVDGIGQATATAMEALKNGNIDLLANKDIVEGISKKINEVGKEFTARSKADAEEAKKFADQASNNVVSESFDPNKIASQIVDSFFTCIAQAISGLNNDDEPERIGPPCFNPNKPGKPSLKDISDAETILDFRTKAASGQDTGKGNVTQPENFMNLVSTLKRLDDFEKNTEEIRDFLAQNEETISPSKRRCLEATKGFKNLGYQGAIDLVNNPQEFFSKLDTDNSMKNISFTPEAVTEIQGGDVGDILGGALSGVGLGGVTETMDAVLKGIEGMVAELDKFVTSVNMLTRFTTSRDFCCVIYILVLLGNAVKGKAICPDNDISNFFKYAGKIKDKKEIAELKVLLGFLKAIIDTIRHSFSLGLQINGITIPLKDLMEQVRYTISNISKLLIDMVAEPWENALDSLLLNPEIQGIIANNCPLMFDFLAMLKCGLEWLKLKINGLVLELFQNNFENLELIRSIRIGGMRFKIMDMLSRLLGNMINLLISIGDCYDGDEYIQRIVSDTVEKQYSDAERVLKLLQAAQIKPEEFDKMTKTESGESPLDLSLSPAEDFKNQQLLSKGLPGLQFPQDDLTDYTGQILTPKTVSLIENSSPLANLVDEGGNLLGPAEFVKRIEEFSGVSISQTILDLYSTENSVYDIFKETAA